MIQANIFTNYLRIERVLLVSGRCPSVRALSRGGGGLLKSLQPRPLSLLHVFLFFFDHPFFVPSSASKQLAVVAVLRLEVQEHRWLFAYVSPPGCMCSGWIFSCFLSLAFQLSLTSPAHAALSDWSKFIQQKRHKCALHVGLKRLQKLQQVVILQLQLPFSLGVCLVPWPVALPRELCELDTPTCSLDVFGSV